MAIPCRDYLETKGVIFFPRMLDKIRLREQGLLPAAYNYLGCPVWDCFDARFCRFFGVNPEALVEEIRRGGTDEAILEWCFETFGRPNEEKIAVWNDFVVKRGWRDESSDELRALKAAEGLADRDDIQTWVDYHDVDEGRTPRFAEG